ncbi:MAG: OmpA family protein [Bacteroidia bacterium]
MKQTLFLFLTVIAGCKTNKTVTDKLSYYEKVRAYEILFHMDSDEIRPESYPYLDSLSKVILEKQYDVEIGVHVDTRWRPVFSTCMSCKRAEKIENYFILKGINSGRIITKGYNATSPIINQADIDLLPEEMKEDAHHINRRVEFILTKRKE